MTIQASVIDASPPFVRVVVDGQTAPEWSVWRVQGAQTSLIRGGSALVGSGNVLDDTEAPFSEPLSYRVLDNADESTVEESGEVVLVAGGYVWLTDPLGRAGVQVEADSWPELEHPFFGGVFRTIGRNTPVVVSGARTAPSGTLEASTQTAAQRASLLGLLGPSEPFQLRASCPEVWRGYWVALDVTERRVSNSGSDARRIWDLNLQQVDRPDPDLVPTIDTLWDLDQSLGDTPGTGTLLLLSQTYPGTLLDIAAASVANR